MRVAAEPAPVGRDHLTEVGDLAENDVSERQLEAPGISLAHGEQAPPHVRPAADSHDPDIDPGDSRDLPDDERILGAGQEPGLSCSSSP